MDITAIELSKITDVTQLKAMVWDASNESEPLRERLQALNLAMVGCNARIKELTKGHDPASRQGRRAAARTRRPPASERTASS